MKRGSNSFLKSTLSIFTALLFYVSTLYGQSVIEFQQKSSVAIEGKVRCYEWADADTVQIFVKDILNANVLFKHDGLNIYFAYHILKNEGDSYTFPEIFIDPLNDKAGNWQTDDLWFHVSATDCNSKGEMGIYSNCLVEQEDWKGAPNYPMGESSVPIFKFEISIPIEKLGIKINEEFGLIMSVELVPDMRGNYPANADINSPATWGTARLVK